MATSLASQLQAIRSIALTDSAPQKRPFTRPSILFDPKEAADKSTESIYTIAAQGLEVLISTDERFRNYKNSLFSPKSKELDRGLKTEDENKQLNSLINPYLRLISGYFNLPAALQTLEYLIRVYKIHEHNVEDLILCSLPYHDTHAFVRVVQILKIRNRIWEFLKGVKDSGATLPRMVVVQQCLRDGGELLKSLCDYASPSKNPSKNVIGFCTAVVVEVLGVRVDEDIVKIIHPFVNSGLQPDKKDLSDHKASSLMIVCLLGHKTTLAPSLLNGLIRSVAGIARACEEAKDLHWFRLSLIALINLVQSQNVDTLPTKALDVLKKLRDLPGVLLELSKEFNIEKFLVVLLDSLIICSSKDEDCQQALLSLIEKVPINDSVHHVITKILSTCVKLSEKVGDSTSSMSAGWAKETLKIVDMKYPSELRAAVHHFLQQHNTAHSKKDNSFYKILCKMLDGNLDSSSDISKSKVWFGLYHPKADIRRTTLLDINSSGILKNKAFVSEGLIDILEAILRQFDDEDLTVVQAALNVDGLENVPDSSKLLEALQNVLRRCVGKMLSGSTDNVSLTCEVAVSCLKKAISYFHDQKLKSIAAMIYPLLLAMPQTQDLNLKALVLVKEINWQLYDNIAEETTSIPGCLSSINLKVIEKLAGNFMVHHEDNIDWFVKSCNDTKLSKTLFFFVLLQSLVLIKPKGDNDFSALFESVFPILKAEWESSVNAGDVLLDEFNSEVLDLNSDCSAFFDQLLYAKLGPLNAKVMSCIFWRLIKALVSEKSSGNLLDDSKIKDLFVFFALSKFGNVFHEHLHFLAAQFRSAHLLSKFFTDEGVPAVVQVESLQCYGSLCTLQQNECQTDLLAEFPSLLVPLAGDDKSVRDASLECIVKLHALWGRIEHGFQFLDELLIALVQIKKLILSDKKILSALFTSSLGSTPGSSYHNILLPPNMQNRFAKKEEILEFILGYTEKFSNYGKLMILSLLKGIGNPIIMHPKIASMLSNLMERYYDKHGNSFQKFSNTETRILCLLLENCVMSSPSGGDDLQNSLLKVLQLDGMTSDNPAYVEPCITVLKKLSSQFYTGLQDKAKEQLCLALVFLCRNANGDVQIATREALMRINIDFKTVGRILDPIIAPKYGKIRSADEKLKKRQKLTTHHEEELDDICRIDNLVDSLSSLLDVLLLKKDIANRHSLLDPLFKLLGMVFSEEWVNYALSLEEGSSQPPSSLSETVNHIQQTLLIILEDIIMSHDSMAVLNEKMTNEINIKLLIDCARSTDVVVTRNHIFSLLSAVIRVLPEKVFGHLIDILPVIGESAVTQIDSHSKHAFEDLISAIVPCWLSKTDDVEKLLKVFIDIFPEIVEHRRLSIVLYLLRTLGEGKKCLASLLRLLFSSLVSRNVTYFLNIETPDALTLCTIEWEYKLAVQICEQYASMTWLPSLVSFYEQRGNKNVDQSMFLELFLAMRFCLQKLQDPELLFKLESGVDSVVIQSQLGELMEHVVFLLHLVDARKKELNFPVIMRKELKETMRAVVLIFFAITFGFIINFIRKFNKKPEGLENIPYISFISLLKILWAYFQQKNYDEVEDLVQELIGGHHDIYLSQFGIVLNNPEYAKILLTESEDVAIKYYSKTDNVFFDKFFGCGLSLTNGDKWRSTRKLADSALNLASHQYPEVVGEITMDLFTFMNPNLNRPINIIEPMRRISIEALGKFAFGYKFGCLESQEVPRLISVYEYIVSVLGSPFRRVFPWISELPLESNKKYLDAIKEFDGFINDIIETKRNEMKKDSYNGHDLLTSMIKQGEINIDKHQLRDEIATFFTAGHDTTTTALSVSLYFLAKYPEMQEKARAEVIRILGNEPIIPSLDQLKELKYVNAIIKETLRTHPPTPILTVRRLKKPIKVGSYILPINSTCMINTWKIHRDPKYWENPNQYNPERFLSSDEKRDKFAWIPFSAGPRNCVGQNLTLLQQRVVLSMFLLRYKWVLPENNVNKDKILLRSHFLLTPIDIKLVFTERINE